MMVRITCNNKTIRVNPTLHPDQLCHGQACHIRLTGCRNIPDTVVPCHANWISLGKGRGIKVPDIYTVPGCFHCHQELDQGNRLLKSERKAAWLNGYRKWGPYRERTYGVPYKPVEVL